MSDIKIEDKPKNKYYNEKSKEYMRKYRAKRTDAYLECTRSSSKKYQDKIRYQAKEYQKLLEIGLLPISPE